MLLVDLGEKPILNLPSCLLNELYIDAENNTLTKYRKYDSANNECFYYFVTRILAAVNVSNTNFNNRKTTELISQIFSVTDEALALLILENELHVWKEQRKPQNEQNTNNLKRNYVNGQSGKHKSWSKEGKKRFHTLCIHIKELRLHSEFGNKLEQDMKERFLGETENGKNNKSKVSFFLIFHIFFHSLTFFSDIEICQLT